MPELPEVQCVINTLQRMVGKVFSSGAILNERLREPVQPDLMQNLEGQAIVSIRRMGKYILIELDHGHLVCHLGMTGKLVINADEAKHDRIRFVFNDGTSLVYNDVRKFGFVIFERNLATNKYLRHLGTEPLGDAFTVEGLLAMTASNKTPIKVFLLDQRKIAGLGNIYVNEVLYECGISPHLLSRDLTKAQANLLVPAIKAMLLRSIELGGSSISDYRDADDKKGSFQDSFRVYGRDFDHLGNAVIRATQGGRSTFYVEALQGLPGA